jgi:hypothetical protein
MSGELIFIPGSQKKPPKTVGDWMRERVDAIKRWWISVRVWLATAIAPGVEMDPNLIVATIAAALQAIDTWTTQHDRHKAAEHAKSITELKRLPIIDQEARVLRALVPEPILQVMTDRVQKCWTRYQEVLVDDGAYLPAEVDAATLALQRCICRELKRIRDLNGEVPAGQLARWETQYCSRVVRG